MGVRFVLRLAEHGERTALLFGDGSRLTYCELAALVAARAVELGAERRLILWEARPDPAAIITYLAALSAGHPVLPVAPLDSHAHAARHRAALIDAYRPDIIATAQDGSFTHHAPKVENSTPSSPAYNPDLSLLLSTSGSTGEAKLVRLSAANLDANAGAIADYLSLTPDDRAMLILPLHYAYGLSVLHAHLAVGASLYLGAPAILAPDFIARLRGAGCTNISGIPYSFELLEQIGFRDADLPDLRFMTVAGGRLSPDLVRLYAGYMKRRCAEFFVMYGQTEATARIAYLPPSAAIDHADSIGHAIPGGTLALKDENGSEIEGALTSGELIYRGPNVMMGYANSRADLARGAALTDLSTGDLAERTEAGFYRITGRSSRISKIAGLRISHDAIERTFEARGIKLAVIGDDRYIRAAFTGSSDAATLRAEIALACGLNAGFIRVAQAASLPRRANGKIDYVTLWDLFDDGVPKAVPGSILQAFADTFAPRHVTAKDSFVSLGGDSLSFVHLSLALEPILREVPRDWENRTIADLTARSAPIKERPLRAASWQAWRAGWRQLDANLFMRALAILLVVIHHATLWPMSGGAATLLLLVGYNLARFHGAKLMAGRVAETLRAVLRPLALYYAVLLVYCLYTGSYPWQSLALLGNLGIYGYSTMSTPLVAYWFIEAYAQLMLLIAALFALPWLRAAVCARPVAAGLAFLALAVIAREVQPLLWDAGEMRAFATPRVLYLVAIGWCLYFADDLRKRILMTVLVAALFLLLPFVEEATATILWVRASVLISSSITLLWCANIAVPGRLASVLSAVAAASYSIYLFHNVPFFLWLDGAGIPQPMNSILHIALGLGLGFLAHHILQAIGRWGRTSSLAQMLSRLGGTETRALQPGE